mmetsp:Transcript_13589/g.25464  ORF Transcript_13589/g.25464 Transcript_13589/m.25464 type:complete len:111 (-) Transcript_13589:1152-1484(-)
MLLYHCMIDLTNSNSLQFFWSIYDVAQSVGGKTNSLEPCLQNGMLNMITVIFTEIESKERILDLLGNGSFQSNPSISFVQVPRSDTVSPLLRLQANFLNSFCCHAIGSDP